MLRLWCFLMLTLLLYACRPSSEVHEVDPAVVLDFPLRGEWRLLRSPGHDAFAYDLAATGGPDHRLLRRSRWQHLLGRTTVEDSYSWGEVVHAPADDEVVVASDGWPDRQRLHLEVFDQVDDLLSTRTLPFHIREFERWTGQVWEPQRNAPVVNGERVRFLPDGEARVSLRR